MAVVSLGRHPHRSFVDVLQRYSAKTRPTPDAEFLPPLKQKHRALLEAIEAGRVAEAMAVLQALFDQSRRWVNQLEREQNRQAGSPFSPG